MHLARVSLHSVSAIYFSSFSKKKSSYIPDINNPQIQNSSHHCLLLALHPEIKKYSTLKPKDIFSDSLQKLSLTEY